MSPTQLVFAPSTHAGDLSDIRTVEMRGKSLHTVWVLCASCSVAFEWAPRAPRMCRGGYSHFSRFFPSRLFSCSGWLWPKTVRGARRKRAGKESAKSLFIRKTVMLRGGKVRSAEVRSSKQERLTSGVTSASAISYQGRLIPGSMAHSCSQYPLAQLGRGNFSGLQEARKPRGELRAHKRE